MTYLINNTLPFERCNLCVYRVASFKYGNNSICYKCIKKDRNLRKLFDKDILREE